MHKNNIPQSTNKSNKSYQHARLFDFDLLQFNRMKRQISIKIYCWMVFHARITYQDQKVMIRKTGTEKNNIWIVTGKHHPTRYFDGYLAFHSIELQ